MTKGQYIIRNMISLDQMGRESALRAPFCQVFRLQSAY
jgi:hypothetical protein